MDEEFLKKSVEMAKLAVEKCLLTDGIQYVTVMDEGGEFRVKATKRLDRDKKFFGEMLVTIGPPNCREKERIANMKKRGKVPEFFFKVIGKSTRKRSTEEYFF